MVQAAEEEEAVPLWLVRRDGGAELSTAQLRPLAQPADTGTNPWVPRRTIAPPPLPLPF